VILVVCEPPKPLVEQISGVLFGDKIEFGGHHFSEFPTLGLLR
jgi:hypothetical protein